MIKMAKSAIILQKPGESQAPKKSANKTKSKVLSYSLFRQSVISCIGLPAVETRQRAKQWSHMNGNSLVHWTHLIYYTPKFV